MSKLPLPLSSVPERFTLLHPQRVCSFGAPHGVAALQTAVSMSAVLTPCRSSWALPGISSGRP